MPETTFDEIRADLVRAFEALQEANAAQTKMLTMLSDENAKLWVALAELRNEMRVRFTVRDAVVRS